VHVAELVRDHRAALAAVEVVQQRVVENDALGGADPVDVGVDRGRAPARIHAVDLADVHPGLLGQLEHVAARLPRRQRLEFVEQRREDDRREPGEDPCRDHHTHAAGYPPAAAEAAHQAECGGPDQPSQYGSNGRALRPVVQPAAQGLRGKAHVDRALMGGDPERNRDHRYDKREPGRRGGAAEDRARTESLQGASGHRRPSGGQQDQDGPLGHQAPDQDQSLA
jgi:hypothetical protein